MTSRRLRCQNPRRVQNRFEAWAGKFLWSVLGFVAGVICGPITQYVFFQSLPGPTPSAQIQVSTGIGGCDLYSIEVGFPGGYTIDKLNFAVQFPGPIKDRRLGVSKQVTPHAEYAGVFLFHGGEKVCEFMGSAEVPPPNIQAGITWPNKFEFQGTDIHNPLSAQFILPKDRRATTLEGTYSEGTYEYRVFGITVHKSLFFKIDSVPP